jgi:hypothetical protein
LGLDSGVASYSPELLPTVYRSAETLQLLINRSTSGLRRGYSLSRDGKKGKKVLACVSEILHQSKGRIGQFLLKFSQTRTRIADTSYFISVTENTET